MDRLLICYVTMSTAVNCTATFNFQTFSLNTTNSGAGNGTITSSPTGSPHSSGFVKADTRSTRVGHSIVSTTPAPRKVFRRRSVDGLYQHRRQDHRYCTIRRCACRNAGYGKETRTSQNSSSSSAAISITLLGEAGQFSEYVHQSNQA
jgi:hypothetical protein